MDKTFYFRYTNGSFKAENITKAKERIFKELEHILTALYENYS